MDWQGFDIGLNHEASNRLLRGLKGGSGGGGGGSSGGGGRGGSSGGSRGYYGGSHGNNNTYGGGGSGGGMPLWGIITLVVGVVFGVTCCCVYKAKKKKDQDFGPGTTSDTEFNDAVSNARAANTRQQISPTNDSTSPEFETYEGDFDVKYLDRHNVHDGFVKLKLKNSISCYKVEGDCRDADGAATITEGYVTYSGEAWWVEETCSGTDKGLKVLTEGKFDFNTNSFTGTWKANSGVQGSYTAFKGKNVSKNFTPGGAVASNPQTLNQMLEEDIPMAVATVETPVFTATPVVQAVPESAYVTTSPALPNLSAPQY